MLVTSKIRTPEQKLRKMLNEENTILALELAIKKEQFRKAQKLGFNDVHMENNDSQMELVPVNKTNGKISQILHYFLKRV